MVAGLRGGELAGLKRLALTEAEFRDLVWPKLPASRPERNRPMDYVWGDLAGKSDANLRARLGGWQDRGFVLVPLADIAPDWRHPLLGRTIREMRDALPAEDLAGIVRLEEEG